MRKCARLTLSICILLLLIGCAVAKPRKLSKKTANALLKVHLRPGETLAHAAFSGPFGPSKQSIFVLVDRRLPKKAQTFDGFVVADKRHPLPIPDTQWPSGITVVAVILDDIDKDGVIEPIIMTTYMTGMGPDGAKDQHENFVVDWRKDKFVRLPAVEKRIKHLSSAKKIRAKLRSKRK